MKDQEQKREIKLRIGERVCWNADTCKIGIVDYIHGVIVFVVWDNPHVPGYCHANDLTKVRSR